MRRYLPLLPALLYMALIFVLSSRPAPEALQNWPIFLKMKLVHLLEYGFLATLWVWGLRRATIGSTRYVGLAAIIIASVWGVFDEIHQFFVQGRTARVEDAVTNLIAAVVAVALWRMFRRFRAQPQ